MPITAPILLPRVVVTEADSLAAQTMRARALRILMMMGRAKYSAEWARFQADAPPFVVTGLQELMDAWQKLESGSLLP